MTCGYSILCSCNGHGWKDPMFPISPITMGLLACLLPPTHRLRAGVRCHGGEMTTGTTCMAETTTTQVPTSATCGFTLLIQLVWALVQPYLLQPLLRLPRFVRVHASTLQTFR